MHASQVVQLVKKNQPASVRNASDAGSIPGLGRPPAVGNGNPVRIFQYFCLENPMDRGTQWAKVHGVTISQTQLSTHTSMRTTKVWSVHF